LKCLPHFLISIFFVTMPPKRLNNQQQRRAQARSQAGPKASTKESSFVQSDSQASSTCDHELAECVKSDDLCLRILDPSYFNKTTKREREVAALRNKSANVLIRVLEKELQGGNKIQSFLLLTEWWQCRRELEAKGARKTEEGEKVHAQISRIVKDCWNKEFSEIGVLCEMSLDPNRDHEAEPYLWELLSGASTEPGASTSGTSASETFARLLSDMIEQHKNSSF
jgi:hypothetical protein